MYPPFKHGVILGMSILVFGDVNPRFLRVWESHESKTAPTVKDSIQKTLEFVLIWVDGIGKCSTAIPENFHGGSFKELTLCRRTSAFRRIFAEILLFFRTVSARILNLNAQKPSGCPFFGQDFWRINRYEESDVTPVDNLWRISLHACCFTKVLGSLSRKRWKLHLLSSGFWMSRFFGAVRCKGYEGIASVHELSST